MNKSEKREEEELKREKKIINFEKKFRLRHFISPTIQRTCLTVQFTCTSARKN